MGILLWNMEWNGMEWIRFRHEPWTANLMWNVQVSLQTHNIKVRINVKSSQLFLMVELPLDSLYMQTRQSYLHLEQRKGILFWQDVHHSLFRSEMELVLVVVHWLVGSPL